MKEHREESTVLRKTCVYIKFDDSLLKKCLMSKNVHERIYGRMSSKTVAFIALNGSDDIVVHTIFSVSVAQNHQEAASSSSSKELFFCMADMRRGRQQH